MNRLAGTLSRLTLSRNTALDPLSLSPYLWLDAGRGVEVTTGTPAADTNTVQRWVDQSGNSAHAVQATAGNRMQYRTNILSGKPVIRGSSARFMTGALASSVSNENISMFSVLNIENTSRNVVFSLSDAGFTTAPQNLMWAFYNDLSSNEQVFKNAGSGTGSVSWTVSTTPFSIHSANISGSSVETFRNGASLGVQTKTGQISRQNYILCAATSGNVALVGDLAELLVFPALSAGDHARVVSYLSAKYTITI